MASKTWKSWERYLAGLFGGERRGAHTSDGTTGETDVIHSFWGIEAKLLKAPHYDAMVSACSQAEINSKSEGLVPVAIVKRNGDRKKDALVCFRLETFQKYFIDPIADVVIDDRSDEGWERAANG